MAQAGPGKRGSGRREITSLIHSGNFNHHHLLPMKIVRNLLILAVVAILIALGVAFFSINTLVKKAVETAGPMAAKVETRLGSAHILPFTGTGKLSQIFIGNPAGSKTPYALKVESIAVGVNLPSIKTNTVIIDSINIQAPDIYIEGGLVEKNNLTTINRNIQAFAKSQSPKTEKVSAPETPAKAAEPGKKVIVKDLKITGAKVHWVSTLTLGQEVLLTLPDIHLQNIGQDKKGITWSELSNLVMSELMKASSSVSAQNLNKAVEQIKEKGLENINKATDGLKGIFRK